MSTDERLVHLLRVVVEAARAGEGVEVPVRELEAHLGSRPGAVVPRPWGSILVGWQVRTPAGQWFTVTSSRRQGMRQELELKDEAGKKFKTSRPHSEKAQSRRVISNSIPDAAYDALAAEFNVEVLEDPPWD